ncbi:MAG: hypothetical protein H5T59_14850, partial [Anaerolineae bacterium]|nr:hypothetical protein [Anaerolineae bacterium]
MSPGEGAGRPTPPPAWLASALRLWRRPGVRQAVGWGAVLAIAVFWGRNLAANWQQVRALRWQVAPLPLLVSFPLLLAHLAFLAGIWSCSLTFLGEQMPRGQAIRVWLLTQIARYLPGGTWDALARMAVG